MGRISRDGILNLDFSAHLLHKIVLFVLLVLFVSLAERAPLTTLALDDSCAMEDESCAREDESCAREDESCAREDESCAREDESLCAGSCESFCAGFFKLAERKRSDTEGEASGTFGDTEGEASGTFGVIHLANLLSLQHVRFGAGVASHGAVFGS